MSTHIQLSSKNYIELNYLDHQKRDLILIFPGGGYQYTSSREGKPVSDKFQRLGYHTAIYHYRETLLIHPDVIQEVKDVLEKLRTLEFIDKLFVLGFSAGSHLALHAMITYPKLIDGGILGYPVVSSMPAAIHKGSFRTLTGSDNPNDYEQVSLENLIHTTLPPIFIFHTSDDASVPVVNTLLLKKALEQTKTRFEIRLYDHGPHGLSIATKEVAFEGWDKDHFEYEFRQISGWVNLAHEFLKTIE